MNLTDKPLGDRGLISYRYKGRYGYIMIGAKTHAHALSEAARSLSDNSKPDLILLDVWNGYKYVPAMYNKPYFCCIRLHTGEKRYIKQINDSDFSYSLYSTGALIADKNNMTKAIGVLGQLQYENHPSDYDQCGIEAAE